MSPLKLVDSVDEQAVLEELIETLQRSCARPTSEIIRYASVRNPGGGVNLALLTCRVFVNPGLVEQQTWHIRLSEGGLQAIREFPKGA